MRKPQKKPLGKPKLRSLGFQLYEPELTDTDDSYDKQPKTTKVDIATTTFEDAKFLPPNESISKRLVSMYFQYMVF